MDLVHLANLAQVIGVPLGLAALIYSGWQLRQTRLIERGRFMPDLECMSQRFDRVQTLTRGHVSWIEWLHRVGLGADIGGSVARSKRP